MPQTIVVRTQGEQNEIEKQNAKITILFFLAIGLGIAIIFIPSLKWIIGAIIVVLIILIINKKRKKGWQKIERLPNWAYRRMKRKRKNIVRGKHHLYKREGNKFYKKLRR